MWRVILVVMWSMGNEAFPLLISLEGAGKSIEVKSDPLAVDSFISSRDFDCFEAEGCRVISGYRKVSAWGRTLAYVKISFRVWLTVDGPPVDFQAYLFDDENENIGSVVGLGEGSVFLSALDRGYGTQPLFFKLDVWDQISFQKEAELKEGGLMKIGSRAEGELRLDDGWLFEGRKVGVCFEARVELINYERWLLVQPWLFDSLRAKLNERQALTDDDNFEKGISIRFPNTKPLASLPLDYDLLVGPGIGVAHSSRLDCDIFFGTLILEALDYSLTYRRVDGVASVQLALTRPPDRTSPREKPVVWWKILVVCFLAIGGLYADSYYRAYIAAPISTSIQETLSPIEKKELTVIEELSADPRYNNNSSLGSILVPHSDTPEMHSSLPCPKHNSTA